MRQGRGGEALGAARNLCTGPVRSRDGQGRGQARRACSDCGWLRFGKRKTKAVKQHEERKGEARRLEGKARRKGIDL